MNGIPDPTENFNCMYSRQLVHASMEVNILQETMVYSTTIELLRFRHTLKLQSVSQGSGMILVGQRCSTCMSCM